MEHQENRELVFKEKTGTIQSGACTKIQKGVRIYHVNAYEDSTEIALSVIKEYVVIMELGSLKREQQQRYLDFITGVSYIKEARVRKIANDVYVITPQSFLFDEINPAC